jgi:hypothetical protein
MTQAFQKMKCPCLQQFFFIMPHKILHYVSVPPSTLKKTFQGCKFVNMYQNN